jgi:hypothetical protein
VKRFLTFGSIEEMNGVVKSIKRQVTFVGSDENGEAIYDNSIEMPTVDFTITEKSHGTNSGFSYNNIDGAWYQSGKNIITPTKDNAGCAFMMETNKDIWIDLIKKIAEVNNINLDKKGIVLYAELQGGNVQKNTACSGLEKSFLIFQYCKVYDINNSEVENIWVETKTNDVFVDSPEVKIYNVMNLNSDIFTIDFKEPVLYKNKLIEMVEEIEKNSIIGEKLGKSGNIGEGFVLQAMLMGVLHRFKVKGNLYAKHSGKVKTLKPVDEARENLKRTFVNEVACQPFRLDQMFTEIKNSKYNGDVSMMSKKDTGNYIKLVFGDVVKEHINDMIEKEIEPKEISSMISQVSKNYFFNRLDDEMCNM